MLQNLRDKTQGLITRVIIGLVCVAFVLWGVHNFMLSSGPAAGYLARVNGQDISAAEFGETYQRLLQQRQAQLGSNFLLTPAMENKIKAVALEQLVTTTALAQAAEKKSFRFTPKQVGDVIGGISAFQENGRFSKIKFAQTLSALGFTEEAFFDNVRQAMLINQLRFGLIESSFALPHEVSEINTLVNQKRDFDYLEISPNAFTDKVKIDDVEAEDYYKKHPEQFTSAPTVVLQYLLLTMPKGLSQDKASRVYADQVEQLNNLTYTNPQSLEPAAKALKLAVQTSDTLTADTAAKGIFANPQLKQAAFSKDVIAGNNSLPVNLDDTHVVVIRALKYQPQQVQPFDAVKAKIIQLLRQQKMQELANTEAQNIINQVMTGTLLHTAAAKASIPLAVMSKNGMMQHAAVTNPIDWDAFQLPRPGQQPSVGLFKLPSGNIVVIQIRNITDTKLDSTQEGVQARVMNQQIANAYAQMDYQIYVMSVLANSKINVPSQNHEATNNE